MSCIYKLFTSLLASRLSSFAIDQKLLSDTQKSARPSEGCHEHTFTLQAVIADCKRNNKNCFMAWLDLRNAFGSISHEAIYTTLQHMGIPEDMIALVKDIYTDASTTIKTSANVETIPINIKAGVKQGCPLSPILFNLTTELLIRQVTLKCDEDKKIPFHIHGQPIFILAFADDLVLVSSSRSGLQDILDEVSSAASILNLEFRPDKCASLALTCRKHEQSRVDNATTFKVQNNIMPALSKEQSYRYLGVPISLIYAKEMNTITETLISDLDKLRDSQLAPWQKLDAIRTFIQPCLTYALRSCPVTKDSLHAYRKKLVDVLRSICHLPKRSSVHYFFADRACGGLGIQDPFDERNVQTIVHTIKILSSLDPLILNIAHGQLKSVVYRCVHHNPTEDEIDKFLSGSNDDGLHNHSQAGNSQTLWSRCRKSAKSVGVSIAKSRSSPVVHNHENASCTSKSVASFLHRLCLSKHTESLKSCPDQGKVARCLHSSKSFTSNNWMYDGTGIRFCDWRFIHRARLNILPTNDVKSRFFNDNSPTCRRCLNTSVNESLPHIICQNGLVSRRVYWHAPCFDGYF